MDPHGRSMTNVRRDLPAQSSLPGICSGLFGFFEVPCHQTSDGLQPPNLRANGPRVDVGVWMNRSPPSIPPRSFRNWARQPGRGAALRSVQW